MAGTVILFPLDRQVTHLRLVEPPPAERHWGLRALVGAGCVVLLGSGVLAGRWGLPDVRYVGVSVVRTAAAPVEVSSSVAPLPAGLPDACPCPVVWIPGAQ